jgi:hypothetical protein
MNDAPAPAGWYPDPGRAHEVRYFDGTVWTRHVADNGVTSEATRIPSTPAEVAWLATRGVGAFVAAFVASWWLIGDQTEASIRPGDISYVMRAPDLPSVAVAAAGVVSIVVVAAIVLSLIVTRPRARARREAATVAALAGAAFVLAGSARMETAGSHGANIGGGMAIIVGLPVAVVLVAYALRSFGKSRSSQRLTSSKVEPARRSL